MSKHNGNPPLTDWYSVLNNGQPARPGWYECKYGPLDREPTMNYWNGTHWVASDTNESKLMFGNGYVTIFESWRGLSAPAKEVE